MASIANTFSGVLANLRALSEMDLPTAKALILSLPYLYQDWWLSLYRENPEHIIVETALAGFVLWLIFIRRTVDVVKPSDDRFSDKEVAWLVDTWEPEPMIGEVTARQERRSHGSKLVRHCQNGCLAINTVQIIVFVAIINY
jgi:hypothetical protein